jgi:hypothetical protein
MPGFFLKDSQALLLSRVLCLKSKLNLGIDEGPWFIFYDLRHIFVLLTLNSCADTNQVRSFQASSLFRLWFSVFRTFQCCFLVFLFALGMESRAFCLLDKNSTMWATTSAPDAAVLCGSQSYYAFGGWMPSLESSTPGSTQSCYIQVPNSATVIPTASSDLQRRAVTEPCRMSLMPSQVSHRAGERHTYWTLSVWMSKLYLFILFYDFNYLKQLFTHLGNNSNIREFT